MFFRTERSVKEFLIKYPIVSSIAIINLVLWFMVSFLKLPFALKLYDLGIGHNLSVLLLNEYWRLFTPIFLHADLSDVVFNTFSLVLFGPALGKMIGKFKFISIYLITGIIGNIGTFIVDIQSITPHRGASAALHGLFRVYIYIILCREDLISKSDRQIIITLLVLRLVMPFWRSSAIISAPLFGFLGGCIIAPLVLRKALNFFRH